MMAEKVMHTLTVYLVTGSHTPVIGLEESNHYHSRMTTMSDGVGLVANALSAAGLDAVVKAEDLGPVGIAVTRAAHTQEVSRAV